MGSIDTQIAQARIDMFEFKAGEAIRVNSLNDIMLQQWERPQFLYKAPKPKYCKFCFNKGVVEKQSLFGKIKLVKCKCRR